MKLLIGYDGSPYADAAIDDLASAGLPENAQATVLSVADVWPHLPPLYQESLSPGAVELSQTVGESARLMMQNEMNHARELALKAQQRVAAMFPGWKVEAEWVADSPANALIEKAESTKSDLIVIGSHGRGAIGRLVFGSISQKVIRYAHCSVRIGRKPIEQKTTDQLRVLIGMDTSPDAAAALGAVAGRSWPRHTIVHLVTAVDVRIATVIPVMEASMAEMADSRPDEQHWLAEAQKSSAEELRSVGLDVTTALRDGDPKHVILQEAQDWHADCIFVGAKGLSRIQRFLLGSVSSAVAARAHCTVEIVRFR